MKLRKRDKTESPMNGETFQTQLAEKATVLYLDDLPEKEVPRKAQLSAALNQIQQTLKDDLVREVTRETADRRKLSPEMTPELLKMELTDWMRDNPIDVPQPVIISELDGPRVALAAIIGATIGGFTLTPIFNLLMGQEDLGWILGGPIGAGLFVIALWKASDNPKFRLALQAALGVATFAEVLLAINAGLGLGGLWSTLRGASSKAIPDFVKRIGLYVSTIFFLKLGVRKPTWRRDMHKDSVQRMLAMWISKAAQFLEARLMVSTITEQASEKSEKDIAAELGMYLHKIQQSSAEFLPDVVAELLAKARTLGIEGLEGTPAFLSGKLPPLEQLTWQNDMAGEYNTIGAIEPGDKVFIETRAVVRDGEVIEKGFVRKLRK